MRLINILALTALIWAGTVPAIQVSVPEKAGRCAYAAAHQELNAPAAQAPVSADSSAVLYRVMGVVLIVWVGLAVFLFRIDRRVSALEKEMRRRE